jgi:hypothetical protein
MASVDPDEAEGITGAAIRRLRREPGFQFEVDRVRALVGPIAAFPAANAAKSTVDDWHERVDQQGGIAYREARKYAAEHRFSYISPQATVTVFMSAVADDDAWARLMVIPPDIATEWPETTRIELAGGKAVRLQPPTSARDEERYSQATTRFCEEPIVQEAVRRILVVAGAAEPYPSGADDAARRSWSEGLDRRTAIISEESERFAATHRFSYISPDGVSALLFRLLVGLALDEDGALPRSIRMRTIHDVPAIFVNPLTDGDLSAPVPPGHILVDVTHATAEDLRLLASTLASVQRRLRYQKRAGGRPRGGTLWTREAFLEEFPLAAAKVEKRTGRKPFDTELAAEMGLSEATFGRYKKQFLADLK